MKDETRVRVIHSTPDLFYEAVRDAAASAPVFDGELQRSFTGCYTSLARVKRRAVKSLGGLVQTEALAAAAWWLAGRDFPAAGLDEAWRLHLFNDFHDIITGSCVEPAEADALAQYGRAEDIARGVRLGAVAALGRGPDRSPALPVTVANANPSLVRAPVEFECMADYRPFWKGKWHLRLFRADGREIACQEEQPEALLPLNGWRRRISFIDDLPGVGVSRYEVRAFEGPPPKSADKKKGAMGGRKQRTTAVSPLRFHFNKAAGLVTSLKTPAGAECLAGLLFEPLVVEDAGDSWGAGLWSYGRIAGRFKPDGPPRVIEKGPVRTITRTVLSYKKSRLAMDVCSYAAWPVLEFRLRLTWNEERRRLKLRVPTRFEAASVLCEVPGAAVCRPGDGEERVHGRWLLVEGRLRGKESALGLVNSGQPGFDFKDGEVRLSVLRSAAYCHERHFDLDGAHTRGWKYMDIGVHEFKLLVAAGDPDEVRSLLPGLADHLAAPAAAYAHLPYGAAPDSLALLSLSPSSVRLLACKRAADGEGLIVRLQEAAGKWTRASLSVAPPIPGKQGEKPAAFGVDLRPFEIITLHVGKDGGCREVRMIEEDEP